MTAIFQRPKLESVEQLLRENGLPTSDLATLDLANFFGWGDRANLQGVIGLEVHGTDGLLRSLAVASAAQGRGYGSALVEEIECHARRVGVKQLYLLTETAVDFFERRRYQTVSRDNVSEAIKQTGEFSGLCPDRATVMRKVLGG